MHESGTNQKVQHRWSEVYRVIQMAWGVILAAGILAFSRERFQIVWPPSNTLAYYTDLLGIILLFVIVILVFRWVFATMGEARMMETYFFEFLKPQPGQVYIWTISMSVVLGVLAALSSNILAFSIAFTVYGLLDVWSHFIRNKELRLAFKEARDNGYAEDPRINAWKAIEEYDFERPQVQRIVTLLFFSFLSVILALLARFVDNQSNRYLLEILAYIEIILAISVSEFVIARWRHRRDESLRDRYSF